MSTLLHDDFSGWLPFDFLKLDAGEYAAFEFKSLYPVGLTREQFFQLIPWYWSGKTADLAIDGTLGGKTPSGAHFAASFSALHRWSNTSPMRDRVVYKNPTMLGRDNGYQYPLTGLSTRGYTAPMLFGTSTYVSGSISVDVDGDPATYTGAVKQWGSLFSNAAFQPDFVSDLNARYTVPTILVVGDLYYPQMCYYARFSADDGVPGGRTFFDTVIFSSNYAFTTAGATFGDTSPVATPPATSLKVGDIFELPLYALDAETEPYEFACEYEATLDMTEFLDP